MVVKNTKNIYNTPTISLILDWTYVIFWIILCRRLLVFIALVFLILWVYHLHLFIMMFITHFMNIALI